MRVVEAAGSALAFPTQTIEVRGIPAAPLPVSPVPDVDDKTGEHVPRAVTLERPLAKNLDKTLEGGAVKDR